METSVSRFDHKMAEFSLFLVLFLLFTQIRWQYHFKLILSSIDFEYIRLNLEIKWYLSITRLRAC